MTQKFVVTCEHSSNFVMIFTCIVYVVFVFNILLCTCITVSISILSCQMTFARACKSTNKIQNNTRQPLAILSVIAYSQLGDVTTNVIQVTRHVTGQPIKATGKTSYRTPASVVIVLRNWLSVAAAARFSADRDRYLIQFDYRQDQNTNYRRSHCNIFVFFNILKRICGSRHVDRQII